MENQEKNFGEWLNNLTVTDVMNTLMLTVFTIFILILVVRTFRNKPSA